MTDTSLYTIQCEIIDETNSTVGLIRTTLNTNTIKEPISFKVEPKEGVAFHTNFNLILKKTNDEALKCQFGYYNSFGEVMLEDSSQSGKIFSSTSQMIITQLPSVSDSYEITTFTKCMDSLGKTRTLTYRVNLDADDVFIDEE